MIGPKVLVVEDDQDLLRLETEQLRAEGFQVATASDGASAIMLAQRQIPDAVVLDIGLPGGNGYLVMRRLRSLAPFAQVPIIVVTGRTLTLEEETTLQTHATALLHKPVDFAELAATLRTALGGPGDTPLSGADSNPRI